MYSSELACKDIIARIPTEPWEHEGFKPFPLAFVGLDAWRRELSHRLTDVLHVPTLTENWQRRVHNIHDGVTPVDKAVLVGALEKGTDVAASFNAVQAEEAAQHGFHIDPDEMEVEFLDPELFGIAPIKPRRWTPYMECFASANQYGRVSLLLLDLKNQQLRLMMIMNSCKLRREYLENQKQLILSEVSHYQKIKDSLDGQLYELRNTETEVDAIRSNRDTILADPYMRELLQERQAITDYPDRFGTQNQSPFANSYQFQYAPAPLH
jgi:hypothetical protein